MSSMTSMTPERVGYVPTTQPQVENATPNKVVVKNGRSCSDITKKVFKGLAIAALVTLLAVGIIGIIGLIIATVNPALFGVMGNGIMSASSSIAMFFAKAGAWIAGHAVVTGIAASVATVASVAGIVAVAKSCSNKKTVVATEPVVINQTITPPVQNQAQGTQQATDIEQAVEQAIRKEKSILEQEGVEFSITKKNPVVQPPVVQPPYVVPVTPYTVPVTVSNQ